MRHPPASGTTEEGRTWRCCEGPRRRARSPESERAAVEIPCGGAFVSRAPTRQRWGLLRRVPVFCDGQ